MSDFLKRKVPFEKMQLVCEKHHCKNRTFCKIFKVYLQGFSARFWRCVARYGSGNGGGHNTPGQPAPTFDGSDGIVVIRYLE